MIDVARRVRQHPPGILLESAPASRGSLDESTTLRRNRRGCKASCSFTGCLAGALALLPITLFCRVSSLSPVNRFLLTNIHKMPARGNK